MQLIVFLDSSYTECVRMRLEDGGKFQQDRRRYHSGEGC